MTTTAQQPLLVDVMSAGDRLMLAGYPVSANGRNWRLKFPADGTERILTSAQLMLADRLYERVGALDDVRIDALLANPALLDALPPGGSPGVSVQRMLERTDFVPGPDAEGVYRRPPGVEEYTTVWVTDIQPSRWQYRRTFEEGPLNDLAQSLVRDGLMNPPLVFLNEEGKWELIAGERRYRAWRRIAEGHVQIEGQAIDLALYARMPVRAIEGTRRSIRLMVLNENLQRENPDPVDEGLAFEQLATEEGMSEAEVARVTGRPRSYIQQRRAIAGAAPAIQAALAEGTITFSQARGFAAGAAGNHWAQTKALESLKSRNKWDGPANEGHCKAYAEEAILTTAKQSLAELGWKVERPYFDGKYATLVFTDFDRPVVWTAKEIIRALAEKHGPHPTSGILPKPAPHLTPDEEAILTKRDLEIDWKHFAPWAVELGKKIKVYTADELHAVITKAREDIQALEARFAAKEWTVEWRQTGGAEVVKGKGKKKQREWAHSWQALVTLATKLENGTLHQANTRPCSRCQQPTRSSTYVRYTPLNGGPERGGYLCDACAEAKEQARIAALAGIKAELGSALTTWLAATPPRIARYLLAGLREIESLGIAGYMETSRRTDLIALLNDAQAVAVLEEAILESGVSVADFKIAPVPSAVVAVEPTPTVEPEPAAAVIEAKPIADPKPADKLTVITEVAGELPADLRARCAALALPIEIRDGGWWLVWPGEGTEGIEPWEDLEALREWLFVEAPGAAADLIADGQLQLPDVTYDTSATLTANDYAHVADLVSTMAAAEVTGADDELLQRLLADLEGAAGVLSDETYAALTNRLVALEKRNAA